jgi:DNA modification methylase
VIDADGEEVIAVRRSNLTPEQKTRLALYDNRAAELAEWDVDVLAGLSDEGTLEGLFTSEELDALLAQIDKPTGDGGDDFDTTPDDTQTRVQRGDLWLLGDHRLLCGDSTNAEDVAKLMGGERAALLATDPPYGVNFQSNNREEKFEHLDGDSHTALYDAPLKLASEFLLDGSHAYVFFRWDKWAAVAPLLLSWLDIKNVVVIKRRHLSMGDLQGAFASSFETCAFGHKGRRLFEAVKIRAYSDHRATDKRYAGKGDYAKRLPDLWDDIVATEFNLNLEHPTQKSIEVMGRIIELSSKSKSVVYDPFLGSGTTLIAAERTGRKCYGLEIEPKYCDVILRRWEAETGREAVRVDSADSAFTA